MQASRRLYGLEISLVVEDMSCMTRFLFRDGVRLGIHRKNG